MTKKQKMRFYRVLDEEQKAASDQSKSVHPKEYTPRKSRYNLLGVEAE